MTRGRLCPVTRVGSVSWNQATAASVVLVTGPEALLAERAVDRIVAEVRAESPQVEVTRIEAAAYQPGQLGVVSSPSLFGEPRVVVLEGLHVGNDAVFADLPAYVLAPEPDVVLVVVHASGNRGRGVLDKVRKAAAVHVACDAVKRESDKAAFARAELRAGARKVDEAAVQALVDACGADLRELAGACQQLISDTSGTITADVVGRYYSGRVEATGFSVADAAVAGESGKAVALLRHALATGTDPVPVVAALASRLRTLAKVAAARGRSMSAQDLGMAPWQLDRARRDLVGWRPETLAAAITAVAQADAEVKGAGRDPVFAVERAVLRVAAAADR